MTSQKHWLKDVMGKREAQREELSNAQKIQTMSFLEGSGINHQVRVELADRYGTVKKLSVAKPSDLHEISGLGSASILKIHRLIRGKFPNLPRWE